MPHLGESKAVHYEMVIRVHNRMIFKTLEKAYQKGLIIGQDELIKQIQNLPDGFVVQKMSKISGDSVEIEKNTLRIKKLGKFTLELLLAPKGGNKLLEKTVQATIIIKKQKAPKINFELLKRKYAVSGEITAKDIENQLRPLALAQDYVLHEITKIDDTDLLLKKSKTLQMRQKTGKTNITFVFRHPFKEDLTLTGAFEITKTSPENFNFKKLSKPYQDNGRFLEKDILANLQLGDTKGYTLKNVERFSDPAFKKLDPVTKEILFVEKLGTFTVDLVLEHPTKEGAKVRADFQITRGKAENLLIDKITKKYQENLKITPDRIFTLIGGNKNNYSITNIDVTTNPTATKIGRNLNINKIGKFTAQIFLEHPLKEKKDIIADFQIDKGNALLFTFTPLVMDFQIGGWADSKSRFGKSNPARCAKNRL